MTRPTDALQRFEHAHEAGSAKHPEQWFNANLAAVRAINMSGGRPEDPQTKAMAAEIVLRVLDMVKEAPVSETAQPLTAKADELHPVVHEAIDGYAKYYAAHHKLGLSIRDDMRYVAQVATRWAIPEGMVLVPKQWTSEMAHAGYERAALWAKLHESPDLDCAAFGEVYKAMLAAAPAPAVGPSEGGGAT